MKRCIVTIFILGFILPISTAEQSEPTGSFCIYGGDPEDGWELNSSEVLYAINTSAPDVTLQGVNFVDMSSVDYFEASPRGNRDFRYLEVDMNYGTEQNDSALEDIAGSFAGHPDGIDFRFDQLAAGEQYRLEFIFALGNDNFNSRSQQIFLFDNSEPSITVDIAGRDEVGSEDPAPTCIASITAESDNSGTILGRIVPFDNTAQGGYTANGAVLSGVVLKGDYVANNPIMEAADPHAMLVDDTVWVYPTSGYYRHFYAYSSNDMVNWRTHGPILNFDEIGWIPDGKHAWAPAIIEKDGTYYFYYSVGPKPSHIGVAYSDSPAGPFTDSGQPLLSDNGNPNFEAIDPMVFRDPVSGKYYLYAGGSAGSRLRVFEMNEEMTGFAREINVDNPYNFTEGAFMHYRDGVYYLSYSHGRWYDSSYSVHYSTSRSPTGPWKYQGAILVTDSRHEGPGHHSFVFNQAINEWYIFYHRWDYNYTNSRMVAAEKFEYHTDGRIKEIKMTDSGVGPVWLGNSLLADFTGNGGVDYNDLKYLTGVWLNSAADTDIYPVGGDGIIDFYDFATFMSQWLLKERE